MKKFLIVFNILCKVIHILFAGFFTLIIISIFNNTKLNMIDDTICYKILSMITLISLWLPIFVRTNFIIKILSFLPFIIYFVLYIAHPLL